MQNFASGEAKFRHPFFKSQTRLHDPPSGVKRVSVWLRLRLRWVTCHARLTGDVALFFARNTSFHFRNRPQQRQDCAEKQASYDGEMEAEHQSYKSS
jgi:hypothetical protein